MKTTLHLSLGVKSIEESVDFFARVMKSEIQHRDPSGYVNIDFFGSQITLKENRSITPSLPDFHFGVNLSLDEFNDLADHVERVAPGSIASAPKLFDAGTPLERKKMYLKCPTGYLIEIKGYR